MSSGRRARRASSAADAEWLIDRADACKSVDTLAAPVNVLAEAHRAPEGFIAAVEARAAGGWPGLEQALRSAAAKGRLRAAFSFCARGLELFRPRRKAAKPKPAKPANIIAQVDASGAAMSNSNAFVVELMVNDEIGVVSEIRNHSLLAGLL